MCLHRIVASNQFYSLHKESVFIFPTNIRYIPFYSLNISFFNTFSYFRGTKLQSHEKTADISFVFNTLLPLLQAQPVHQIKGTVIDKNSRQPLEFINVMVIGLNKGSVTNAEGHFTIEQVPPGIYRLQATAIGYKSVTTPEYILSTRNLNIPIEMEENLTELEGVTVTASPFRRDMESPVSLRIIGLQEIEKSREPTVIFHVSYSLIPGLPSHR